MDNVDKGEGEGWMCVDVDVDNCFYSHYETVFWNFQLLEDVGNKNYKMSNYELVII